MSRPMKALVRDNEDLVRLRDEVAMQALNAMIIAGGWGYTDSEGDRHNYKSMREFSNAAYEFADLMLVARERKA